MNTVMDGRDKLRFGVVGCGSVGPTLAGALMRIEEAQVLAVADVDFARARDLAQKINVSRIYCNDAELIGDPEIDVVCVCTPSGMHAEHAVRALEAGKHVAVEKPMEITLGACDRMIAAQRQSGRKLTIISQHRFDPATIMVKEAIDSGKLGRIILADASVKWWRKQEYYDSSGGWRGTWAMDGGGSLMNQGVHTVDVLQWLTGGVESVFAHTATGAHDIETEDIAVAALKFNCGAIGTLTASTAAFPGVPARIDLYGTEGSAIIEGDRLKQMVLKNGQTFTAEDAAKDAVSVAQGGTASVKDEAARRAAFQDKKPGWGDAHRAQLLDLIRAIREDSEPLINGPAARKPVEIVLAFYESARTQKLVQVAELARGIESHPKPKVTLTLPREPRRPARGSPVQR